jgi:hypothetical protein
MKWLRVEHARYVRDDGAAAAGQYRRGNWFFVAGGHAEEGFEAAQDAMDAADEYVADHAHTEAA